MPNSLYRVPGRGNVRRMSGSLRTALALFLLTGCTGDVDDGSGPPRGPDGEMIEWDAASIGEARPRDSGASPGPGIEDAGGGLKKCVGFATSCSARGTVTCT